MKLSEADHDTVTGWIAKAGFRLKKAELLDGGEKLLIQVEGTGPERLRTASSVFIPTHRARAGGGGYTVIPWAELSASERLILVSSIIYKLRGLQEA